MFTLAEEAERITSGYPGEFELIDPFVVGSSLEPLELSG
jgi:hypothetical protein